MVRVGLTEIKPSVEHRVLEDDSELARTVSGVGGSCSTLAGGSNVVAAMGASIAVVYRSQGSSPCVRE